MTIEFILLILGAYLLGSMPAAYLAVKWSRGIDIRKHGTGKVGAANVLSTAPKWLAIPVALFDIGKGVLTVWAAQLLGLGAIAQVSVGIATVIGHNWPVFLRFKGGRGIFTTLGVITMLSPWLGLITLIIGYALGPVRQIALGVFFALISLPFFSWFLSQPLNIDNRLAITTGFVVLSVIALARRVVVPKTQPSRSISRTQLFFNRLLFDRDIRDRQAWISRSTSRQSGKG